MILPVVNALIGFGLLAQEEEGPPAPVLVGTDTATGSESIALAYPEGTAIGDFALIIHSRDLNANTPPATPSGWTLIGSWGIPGRNISMFMRFVSSTTGNVSFSNNDSSGVMLVFRGVNPSTPYEIISNGFPTTGVPFGAGVVSYDSSLILYSFAGASNPLSSISNPDIPDLVELYQFGTTADNNSYQAGAIGTKAKAGALGNATAVLNGASISYVVIAIAPAEEV